MNLNQKQRQKERKKRDDGSTLGMTDMTRLPKTFLKLQAVILGCKCISCTVFIIEEALCFALSVVKTRSSVSWFSFNYVNEQMFGLTKNGGPCQQFCPKSDTEMNRIGPDIGITFYIIYTL